MLEPDPVLTGRGVTVTLTNPHSTGDTFQLGPLDLDVHRGSVVAIVGASGAGKSTLLSVLSGSRRPDAGVVLMRRGDAEIDLNDRDRARWRRARAHVGFVYQDPGGSLNPRRTVLEQVIDPLRIHGICAPEQARHRALEALRSVNITPLQAAHRPDKLSGGQRQRAAIARALVHDPDVVFLDEPTSALDPSIQAEVLQLLATPRSERTAYVLVTHDLGVVRAIADRVAVLAVSAHEAAFDGSAQRIGGIVEEGTVEERFEHPRSEALRSLVRAATYA